MSNAQPARPRPQDFRDYRAYLGAMVDYLKATRPQFSYRFFARRAGFSSPNFLKLVVDGERNLSPLSIPKFVKGLALDEREAEAFEALVMLGLAETDEERNRCYLRLRRLAGKTSSTEARLEEAQYKVYSLWYALPIREMLALPDFNEDPVWIARRLRPPIKASEASRALKLLEEVGLASRDEGGRLRPATRRIGTAPQVRSLAVRNFHRAMLGLAEQTIDLVAPQDRDITSVTLTLTRAQYEEVRIRIERFRKELLDHAEDTGAEGRHEVYQLSFQLFPLTKEEAP